jgi:hypothetical protein
VSHVEKEGTHSPFKLVWRALCNCAQFFVALGEIVLITLFGGLDEHEAVEAYKRHPVAFEFGSGISFHEYEAAHYVVQADGDLNRALTLAHADRKQHLPVDHNRVLEILRRWQSERRPESSVATSAA